jgi:large subunit ribosomal protein L24e
VIKERRTMRPEARSAARQQAIKESKEKKQAAAAAKKAEKAKNATKGGPRGTITSKAGAKGAPVKVKATTR